MFLCFVVALTVVVVAIAIVVVDAGAAVVIKSCKNKIFFKKIKKIKKTWFKFGIRLFSHVFYRHNF